jgi:hypothetical protein
MGGSSTATASASKQLCERLSRNRPLPIKARWIREQAQQQLKEELGFDTSRADPGKDCVATH